jgi:hypothetical protein
MFLGRIEVSDYMYLESYDGFAVHYKIILPAVNTAPLTPTTALI